MESHSSKLDPLLKSAYWIAGPTASGKSQLAIRLAEKINAEIVSVDSMQVYRGMDIGTAKPTPEELARIPHHMIDVAEIHESFDASRFRKKALQAAINIENRGNKIIFCGGTGLYFQALIHGIGNGPPSDPEVRQDLESESIEQLIIELKERDPQTASTIDLQNKRRLVRALEVVRLTDKSFTSFKSDWKNNTIVDASRFWMLEQPTQTLRKRIDKRVDTMIESGWINETRQLVLQGLMTNSTASQAIGYRQIIDYLNGKEPLESTIQLIKTKTCQYAKRQRTWFRHQIQSRPINMEIDQPDDAIRAWLNS
jgi:tRNA dimethylallyltransferase